MMEPGKRELIMTTHARLWAQISAKPAIAMISWGRLFHEVPIRRIKAPHGSFKILRASRDR